jgi:excisionase family DNA binding protein
MGLETGLFYKLAELAGFLPIAERTLRKLAEEGDLPGAVRFGKLWLVERDKLEEYVGRKLPEPQRAQA